MKEPKPLPDFVTKALGADLPFPKSQIPEVSEAYRLCAGLAREIGATEARSKEGQRLADLIAATIEMMIWRPN